MTTPIYFAPQRVPITDERTGLMSREWYRFFESLWLRGGGINGPSNDDLAQNSAEGVGTSDILGLLAVAESGLAQATISISELLAQVAELRKELEGLRHNPSL